MGAKHDAFLMHLLQALNVPMRMDELTAVLQCSETTVYNNIRKLNVLGYTILKTTNVYGEKIYRNEEDVDV